MDRTAPDKTEKMVVTGKTGSPWGVHGWIKVLSWTEQAETILSWPAWFLEKGEGWEPVEVEAGRKYGKGVVVKFRGCNTPEQAKLLGSRLVAIKRTELPGTAENEYYWTDLEGLTVIDQHGACLGTIVKLMATGSNDVMFVRAADGSEMALPWLPGSVVKEVSLSLGKITVDWDPV